MFLEERFRTSSLSLYDLMTPAWERADMLASNLDFYSKLAKAGCTRKINALSAMGGTVTVSPDNDLEKLRDATKDQEKLCDATKDQYMNLRKITTGATDTGFLS